MASECPEGCRCARHKCLEGCTCGRHKRTKRGPRPDLAERNRSEANRTRPRVISDEARERLSRERTKHGHARARGAGMAGTSTYRIWAAMVQRCTNPNSKSWKWYGAHGVKVCDRWLDFRNFLADMGERPPGLSIDRIDVNGNYEPGNCRWATASEQARNKRNSRHLSDTSG